MSETRQPVAYQPTYMQEHRAAVRSLHAIERSDYDDSPIESASKPRRIVLLDERGLSMLPRAEELIEGMLYQGQFIALVGRWGTFKTFLLLDWALCVALGLDWNGRSVAQGPVVYVIAEGAHAMVMRVAAWKAEKGYTDSLPIYFLPTSLDLAKPADVSELVEAIDALGIRPRLIVFDTLSRCMSGDEKHGQDMKAAIAGVERFQHAYGCAVAVAHHMGWGADRSRGATELPAALDTEITVTREDGESILVLKNTKQKDAAEFAPISLEAMPCAGSLILRPLVPTSSKLTRNERHALTVVQTGEGLTSTGWMEAADLAKGSFAKVRNRLLTLAYVRQVKRLYVATDAGKLAVGTQVQDRYSAGTTGPSAEGQPHPIPKGMDVVPDRSGTGVLS